jgi:hypothetical protein
MMSVDLVPFLSTFGGILTYVLEGEDVESDNLLEPTNIRLFVAWKFEGYKKIRTFIHVLEYSKQFDWNRITLEEHYQKCDNRLSTYTGSIKETWLTDYGTVLTTKLELNFTRRYSRLDLTISEGIRDGHAKRSIWIGPER